MSIQSQIEALEKLSELDAELKELGDSLLKDRQELDTKKGRIAELSERLQRSRQGIEEMERSRGELMGELRQMLIQIDRSREKLSRCRTEREANAVQRELEELRKLHRDREIEIEKLDGLVSQARSDSQQVSDENEKLSADLASIEGDATSRIGVAEREIEERRVKRQALVSAVPAQLYRRYELVRSRRGTALAYTTDGTCSACHMRLQPMLFQKMKRGEALDQCPSCNRIIYYKAAVPAADQQPGDA